MVRFFVGLDLGQSQDYTALSILEYVGGMYYARHLERVRGVAYPNIVNKVTKIMASPVLEDGAFLVVDQTGVGVPVVDLLRQAGLRPIAVSIHGGDKATQDSNNWRVPKRDLVGVLQVLLQTGRLKVASKLKRGPVLQTEMLNFKVKIDPVTAHDSYSAWRESDHDDLVLSVALAAWLGERCATLPEIDYSMIEVENSFGGEEDSDENRLPWKDYIT
jgi:hypothetical protein